MIELLGPLAAMDQSSLLSFASHLINNFFPNSGFDLATGVPPLGNLAGQATAGQPSVGSSFNSTFFIFAIRAILFGYALNWVRKIWGAITHKVDRLLFPTAYISHHEPAYRWVQAWMASEPAIQAQLDHFVLQTRESSKARGQDKNVLRRRRYDDDEDDFFEQSATWESGLVLGRILPLHDQVLRIRHKGCWLWITNQDGRKPGYAGDMVITTLGYQKHALRSFLAATHAAFYSKEEHELLIFHSESGTYTEWMDPISRPARPWSSVILPLKEVIFRDMQRFLSDRETKCYLFHGDPGAGKTTLALASKLRLDIYVISICQSGMDDNKLGELFRNCKPHSIILLEDIDRIFSDNQSISTGSASSPKSPGSDGSGSTFIITPPNGEDKDGSAEVDEETKKPKKEPSVVTMSGLLNAIDGVSSQEGCLLIASTNHPDKLDPALTRAGRFDVRVPFTSASPEQARNLFLHFFPADDFAADRPVDSPYSDPEDDDPHPLPNDPPRIILTKAELEDLAADFARAIFPDGAAGGAGGIEGSKLAMASMQAYLLNFKESPREAVRQAAEWARSGEKGSLLLSSPVMAELELPT